MSTVAIIMATYNGEKYVGDQIDSILGSSYQDFELFIHDDGSKDGTLPLLRTYEEQYPDKIHVYQNVTNMGVTMNFLNALCHTTSDYIMFCDQDDVWKNNKIAITLKRIRHMEAQLGKDRPLAVFTDAVVVDQNLNVIKNSFFCSSHLNTRKTDLPHMLMENKLIGCTVMVNAALRKVIHTHELPTQARFHDWWVGLIASAFGKIGFINDGTLLYRQHGGNVVGDIGFGAYIKNRITSIQMQKEALRALERQANDFLHIYGELLNDHNKEILEQFAYLSQENMIRKRMILIKYGYLKTGIIRNIGLMLMI